MKKLRVTVNNVSYDVEVEILEDDDHPNYGYAMTNTYNPQAIPAQTQVAHPQHTAPAPVNTPSKERQESKSLTSPIPGTIIEIKVAAGDSVKENQPLIILEAMKMNTPINSPANAKVKEIKIKVGDAVQQNQVLLTFE